MDKKKFWETPDKSNLKEELTSIQFKVAVKSGTEPPFKNEFWDNNAEGIYVDVISGEPLFSSTHKYDSKTGWPSFYNTINNDFIIKKKDFKRIFPRVEVRSRFADSHLGHVFSDGPEPTRLRYCINSASLKFIPKSLLKESGYKEYEVLFKKIEDGQSTVTKKANQQTETAYLAGGCFWGVEEIIRKLPGVLDTDTGYSGGITPNPSYSLISSGASEYAETVMIKFDPLKIKYSHILKYFFRLHDPTTVNKQGNDVGSQYRSAIFYVNDEQKETAKKTIKDVENSKKWSKPLVTEIKGFTKFYLAEDEHQDYLQKKPNGYTCHFIRN